MGQTDGEVSRIKNIDGRRGYIAPGTYQKGT